MSVRSTAVAAVAALVAMVVFTIYAHNSGYGYDALEYLVIGREVSQGTSLYQFAPSKGPGIYLLVSVLDKSLGTLGRADVAVVVATIAVAVSALVAGIALRFSSTRLAFGAGAVTWIAAACTEQNFLETEGFVLASGLAAAALLFRGDRVQPTAARALAAGAALGVGALFKAVALAFGPAIAIALLAFGERRAPVRIVQVAYLVIGASVPIFAAASVYALADEWTEFWRWSFAFPLLEYPGDSDFATKTLLKCGWLVVLVAGFAVHVSMRPGAWQRLVRDGVFGTIALMSLFALVPMLKSQASHYAFPAAGCIALAMARGLALVPLGAQAGRLVAGVGVFAAVAMLAAGMARPDAVRRLYEWQSFEPDRQLVRALDDLDPSGGPLLALDRTGYLLQVSGRSPRPHALVNTHAQPARLFREQPALLLIAISDPAVRVLAWNPESWQPDHASFALPSGGDAFRGIVERNFERVESGLPGVVLWRRR
jgi:hypothetical protein